MTQPHLPQTEQRNAALADLDVLGTADLVAALAEDQRQAADAVLAVRDRIGAVIDEIARRLADGGRLHYVGAGTSGRLGVLDASEMPPTFGTPPDLVCAHIAGGSHALRHPVEGAEDDAQAAESEMREHVNPGDAVIGLSASGGARYVVRAIECARARGAYTVALVNSGASALEAAADAAIVLQTGTEALTGSTRLKAGTSQKIALNTISTAVMVRLGKVYENLMVDVVASNVKLRARALRLVETIAHVDEEHAARLLHDARGRVKIAAVMGARGVDAGEAQRLLERERGFLRKLL